MRSILRAATIAIAVSGVPVLAHHPFAAEYDWKKPVTISGTVTRFDWRNPHSMIEVNGKDDHGKDGHWTIELGGPAQLQRMGWTSKQLKNGDKVTIDGWLAKNGTEKVSAKSVTPANGHELFAASSFFDAKQQSASTQKSTAAQGTSGGQVPHPTGTTQRR
jgi:hypothetical protein